MFTLFQLKYTVLDKVEQHLMRSIYSYILANKRKVEFDTDYLKLKLLLKRLWVKSCRNFKTGAYIDAYKLLQNTMQIE